MLSNAVADALIGQKTGKCQTQWQQADKKIGSDQFLGLLHLMAGSQKFFSVTGQNVATFAQRATSNLTLPLRG